jgi:hypothetical protein
MRLDKKKKFERERESYRESQSVRKGGAVVQSGFSLCVRMKKGEKNESEVHFLAHNKERVFFFIKITKKELIYCLSSPFGASSLSEY